MDVALRRHIQNQEIWRARVSQLSNVDPFSDGASMRPLFTVWLALGMAGGLASACSSATGIGTNDAPVLVTLSKATFAIGDKIVARFTNTGLKPLVYGNTSCGVALQGLRGATGEWVTVSPASGACTAEAYSLAPGKTDSVVFQSDATLAPGRYRLTFPAPAPEDSPVHDLLASPAFDLK